MSASWRPPAGGSRPGRSGYEFTWVLIRIVPFLLLAFGHGLRKVPPTEGFVAGVAELGFPAPGVFAWLAGLSEFAGGLLIAAGLLTRPAALLVAITMAVAAFGRHGADPFVSASGASKELALLYLCFALFFLMAGAGPLSLDSAWRRLVRGAR